MFGLTFEKLFLVGIVAAVVIGPQRLPLYAQRLGEYVRAVRRFVDQARADAGVEEWRSDSYDPRRYDPRRIVREAWDERPDVRAPAEPTSFDPEVLAQAERIRPGQRYLVTGDSAHPRRVRLDSLAPDDPRRLAAAPAART